MYQRARELRINPEEVFARAYVEAGKPRSASMAPFGTYCSVGKIPDLVVAFCNKQLPTCGYSQCQNPELPARFSRTDGHGKTSYFCSVNCMDAAPRVESKDEGEVSSIEGMEILERVRIAMSNAVYVKVSPAEVRPLKGQPRTYFSPERMVKLVESLRSVGQMTPGIIRKIEVDDYGHAYELCDGERRLRGVTEAGLEEYRAMLVDIDDEAAPYVVSVVVNFNREGHTLLELADSVQKMHEGLKLSMYQIGRILGIHYGEASKLYGLRRLIPEVRDMLDPNLVKGHPLPKLAAIQISQEPTETQLELAQKMLSKELTVSSLKEHVHHRAVSRGDPIRVLRLSPEKRRRSFKARASIISCGAINLLTLLTEDETLVALQDFPGSLLQQFDAHLEQAQENIARCRSRIGELTKK